MTGGTSERGAWFFTVLGCLAVVLVAVSLVRWASSPRTLQTDDQTAFCSGLLADPNHLVGLKGSEDLRSIATLVFSPQFVRGSPKAPTAIRRRGSRLLGVLQQ